MPNPRASQANFFSRQYEYAFTRPWPVIPSALVIAALSVFLFAYDKPWTASDGVRNWADGFFKVLGLLDQPDLLPLHLYSSSVLNIGLLAGGLIAALLSREFGLRRAPSAELAKGAFGGLLMGCGAMLAFGCNIGGFFSALSALSLSGAAMMVGLLGGVYLSARYFDQNQQPSSTGGFSFLSSCQAPSRPAPGSVSFMLQPLAGGVFTALLIGVCFLYQHLGHGRLSVFLLFGVAFGFIFQRSRFCLVSAFRDPFTTGVSEHARAAALALCVSAIGFAILKATDLKDANEWVFPSFWIGSLTGGLFFGIGMVLAGGCGAGSIWRAGEGQIKLWLTVICFAIATSVMRQFLVQTDLIRQLGSALFLPDLLGWGIALSAVLVTMILWYLLAAWNEAAKQPRR